MDDALDQPKDGAVLSVCVRNENCGKGEDVEAFRGMYNPKVWVRWKWCCRELE